MLLIIAIVGTTVAPWQLFFQQSNIIDKRITPRWINYERLDTWIGAVVVVVGAAALMCVSAFAFAHTPYFGNFTNAGATASGLEKTLGPPAGAFFALVLSNASLIGAGALTLSTSYAFGDIFGAKSSLHRKFSDAKGFYALFALVIAGAAGIVLIPGAPLGVITEAVQALAGVLLPSATMSLTPALQRSRGAWPVVQPDMAERARGRDRSDSAAALIDPDGDDRVPEYRRHRVRADRRCRHGRRFARVGGVVVTGRRGRARATVAATGPGVPREQWTMPPVALLQRPRQLAGRRAAMLAMEAYLLLAIALLIVKAVQLAGG